jgi:hypothetical protein
MSAEALGVLVSQVLEEPGLWAELLALDDRERFAARVSRLGTDRGLDVTTEDVTRALDARRREWFERWV